MLSVRLVKIFFLVLFAAVIGCGKQERLSIAIDTNSVPLAILSKGISNQVEIGMTMNEVRMRRPDLIATVHKTKWGGVAEYSGVISNLGCRFSVEGKRGRIRRIGLSVDPGNLKDRFSGDFSFGISFRSNQIIKREELVDLLGKPDASGTTYDYDRVAAGKSFALRPVSEPLTEIIFYPQHGAIFRFESEVLRVIELLPAPANNK
jgi:hypothetical protein